MSGSDGWTEPTDFHAYVRDLEKRVKRIERGAGMGIADLGDDLTSIANSAVENGVTVLTFRQDEAPMPGVAGVPATIPNASIWFDTNDGNRIRAWDAVLLQWVEADTLLTGITLQTNADPGVGIKFADNGLIAYGTVAGMPGITVFLNATDGVLTLSGALLTGGEVNGGIVTGALIRTDDTGGRIEIDDDGTTGAMRLYSEFTGWDPARIYLSDGTTGSSLAIIGPALPSNSLLRRYPVTLHYPNATSAFPGSQQGGHIDHYVNYLATLGPLIYCFEDDGLSTDPGYLEDTAATPVVGPGGTARLIHLAGSYSAVSGQEPRFAKDAAGNVHMKGLANINAMTSGSTMFTLPATHRPKSQHVAVVRTNSINVVGRMVIPTTGTVVMQWATGTPPTSIGIETVFSTLY